MKKGVNFWTIPGGLSLEESMVLAKKAGFEGIELALAEEGELSLQSDEKEVLKLKEIAKNTDIEIAGLATGLYWKYSFSSNHEDIRQKAGDILKKQLDFAEILGVDNVLVVPGSVGSAKNDMPDYEMAYERASTYIKDYVAYAEKKGVCIGIENVWNKFLLSPLEMRDFIDSFKSSFVGAYFDVGNIILYGYPEQWIKTLGKRICNIHFKDFRRDVGNGGGFVDLLSGDVDFIAVIEALDEVGYKGWVNAEMGGYHQYRDQIVYNTSYAMDRILKKQ